MPSSKVSLGGYSGALDDVHHAYKIDKAMHKRKLDTHQKALQALRGALDHAEGCSEGLEFHSGLAALAGIAIRAMVDLE